MTEELAANLRRFAAQRHYRAATVERWSALPDADAQALLDLATELRLGEHQLGDLWDWADDVAKRDGQPLAAVLDAPELRSARERPLSRNDRLNFFKQALRRLRYPQLSETEDRLSELLRQLDLPRHIQVTPPRSLEGDTLTIHFDVRSPEELKKIAAALNQAADSATFAEIFALLEEAL